MEKTVFDFEEYKTYLKSWIEAHSAHRKGIRSELAAAMRVDLGYFSRVLRGGAHLSLEQADLLSQHLGHSPKEREFFLTLLQRTRAGTASLGAYFQGRLTELRLERSDLKRRLRFERTLTEVEQMTYYSSWHYGAAHMMLAVPELATRAEIQRALGIPSARATEIVDFLLETGLAVESQGRLKIGKSGLHLDNHSPTIARHHTNWRLRAMQAIDHSREDHLHYSSVVSMAAEEVPRAREILIRAIEEVRALVRQSKDEVVWAYNLDLFSIARGKRGE